jgi:5-methylcytosine-specific restriction enzyme A
LVTSLSKFAARHEYHKWYGTPEWRKGRILHLAREPLCRMCLVLGIVNNGSLTAAGEAQQNPRRTFRVVDHIIPHRGDRALFFDSTNWQTLCADHHDRTKQQEEIRGYSNQRGADGWPVDPLHPANGGGVGQTAQTTTKKPVVHSQFVESRN